MSLLDRIADFLSIPQMPAEARSAPWQDYPDLQSQIIDIRNRTQGDRPWRLPSVREALGVPAILRCVTLISHTTGSLVLQAFRNTELVDAPQVVARPDPYRTPRDFYRDYAYLMATRGESVLWIANRDTDGRASALVIVPPNELTVDENQDNRLFPTYKWGDRTSTRYSPANPSGQFVHITYLQEPGELRGRGPLQLAQAAASVSVESQEWAANFYSDGGNGGTVIKSALPIDDAEALNLKNQWVGTPNNIPKVIDPDIEGVDYHAVDGAAAQMLDARSRNDGEASRMFGVPGALLEYGAPGSSLTYQNLADVWLNFVRGCLAPSYLEPLEQAFGDLLPRTMNTRFLTDGLYRADTKTRWEIYQIMGEVLGTDVASQIAQKAEGIAPGNPEVAPIPFAPPAAVPDRLPKVRTAAPLRCDGMRMRKRGAVTQLETCNRLLSDNGTFVGPCPRCKKMWQAA